MQSWIRQLITPPVFEGDEDKTRTARMLNTILLNILLIALVGALATPFVARPLDVAMIVPPVLVLALGSLALMRSGRVRPAAWLFSFGLWGFITVLISLSGGASNIVAGAFAVIVIVAGLLLGGQAALVFAGLSVAAVAGMLVAELNHLLPPHLFFTSLVGKFVWQAGYLILAGAYLSLAIRSITEALDRAQKSNRELQAIRASLEERVEERTRELARRTRYLEATAAIARDAASVLNLEELLERVARQVSERFGLYHTGIFLKNATGEWAELQAASSAGGQRMLVRGHRLQVTGPGMVPYAVSRGESRIALDVGADATFFDNPDLPQTRSEATLPLRARGQIIGALDVQSDQPQAFKQEDITTLQTLADQIALAISNAQLFQQAQTSLEAERRAYAQRTSAAWQEMLQSNPNLGYLYRDGLLVRLENQLAASRSGDQASANGNGNTLQNTPPSQPGALPELRIPITARGNVIGTVNAHKPGHAGEWTPEEIALIQTLTEQLSVALEGARLYQDTQRRAARERLVGEITTRIRESLDMETVLKTALDEMYRALGLDEIAIRLTTEGSAN